MSERLTLVKTCASHPEQYDVYRDSDMVGYMRLGHGRFYVERPDCGGERVYQALTWGDGEFRDHAERIHHLNAGCRAILTGPAKVEYETVPIYDVAESAPSARPVTR